MTNALKAFRTINEFSIKLYPVKPNLYSKCTLKFDYTYLIVIYRDLMNMVVV